MQIIAGNPHDVDALNMLHEILSGGRSISAANGVSVLLRRSGLNRRSPQTASFLKKGS
jgi:hypothetical protein